MRILYASTFDPAGVMTSHRAAIRAAGHECFLGVERVFGVLPGVPLDDSLTAPPDVLVVCPGIAYGENDWSLSAEPPPAPDLPLWIEALVTKADKAGIPKVALFHGSINTARHADFYARLYRARGFVLAATTLDYCARMDAAYLPPIVDVGKRRAKLRGTEHLRTAHTPSNPTICHTSEFLTAATVSGTSIVFMSGALHESVLDAKATCHVGFDHLRGAFSVNTLENAALGLVPLFGLRPEVEERMRAEGISPPPIKLRDHLSLESVLLTLTGSPELTRVLQREGRQWFMDNFSADAITVRLLNFYVSLL